MLDDAIVPQSDIVLRPSPAQAEIGRLDMLEQQRQQVPAFQRAHLDDPRRAGFCDVERPAPCFGMNRDHRMQLLARVARLVIGQEGRIGMRDRGSVSRPGQIGIGHILGPVLIGSEGVVLPRPTEILQELPDAIDSGLLVAKEHHAMFLKGLAKGPERRFVQLIAQIDPVDHRAKRGRQPFERQGRARSYTIVPYPRVCLKLTT